MELASTAQSTADGRRREWNVQPIEAKVVELEGTKGKQNIFALIFQHGPLLLICLLHTW